MTSQWVHWRNYPEEKPQENAVYITTCRLRSGELKTQALQYQDGYFIMHDEWMPSRAIDKSVIAWMPMPIPAYRKDKENELPKV